MIIFYNNYETHILEVNLSSTVFILCEESGSKTISVLDGIDGDKKTGLDSVTADVEWAET